MSKVKTKKRILKAAREKQGVTYKGTPMRLLAGNVQDRKEWHNIFKVFKEKTANQKCSI